MIDVCLARARPSTAAYRRIARPLTHTQLTIITTALAFLRSANVAMVAVLRVMQSSAVTKLKMELKNCLKNAEKVSVEGHTHGVVEVIASSPHSR